MAIIQVLSPHVADLIAAGEVVERPASAVKELIENAVDAGAHTIVAEIRAGGRGSIRITDDGCGMSPEDAGVCFLRHATSKLRDERGLEAIGTLGFRGEALAAISGVSRITLTTRAKGAPTGVRMEVIAGDIETMEETGCPEGTTILVEDLFFNTPARQKFMGSDRSEGLACVSAAMNAALAHPEVSVRCLRDGTEEFFSPGDGKLESAVHALLGRDFARGLIPAHGEGDGVRAEGFISAPAYCRGNRSAQYFYCNGRPIRSMTLRAALEQAYKNTVMVGKFPACVLHITLSAGLVDVNVHPTKAEVKFAREKAVFDAVYYAALNALHPEKAAVPAPQPAAVPAVKAEIPGTRRPESPAAPVKSEPKKDFFRTMDASEFRERMTDWERSTPRAAPVFGSAASAPEAAPTRTELHRDAPVSGGKASLRDGGAPYRVEPKQGTPVHRESLRKADNFPTEEIERCTPAPTPPIPNSEFRIPNSGSPAQPTIAPEFEELPVRCIGETMNTYILLERGDELLIIDKHAAHERILFDRLRLNDVPLMSQELLLPETFTTDGDGAALVENNLPLLERLGFTLESFGDRAFVVRAVPADTDPAQAVPLLEELTEKLRVGRSLDAADVWERLAATVACKAAIKAGWVTEKEELLVLARRVLSGEVTHCPHGRPVMITLSRKELDKRFGRIV